MGRLLFLIALGLAAAASGSSASVHTPIVFGLGGGNMVPYQVTIQPNGVVRHDGSVHVGRTHLPATTVRRLRSEIASAHLSTRECPGVLPDVGSEYIRVGGRTVRVHGSCEPSFTRVWNSLARAVGLKLALGR